MHPRPSLRKQQCGHSPARNALCIVAEHKHICSVPDTDNSGAVALGFGYGYIGRLPCNPVPKEATTINNVQRSLNRRQ